MLGCDLEECDRASPTDPDGDRFLRVELHFNKSAPKGYTPGPLYTPPVVHTSPRDYFAGSAHSQTVPALRTNHHALDAMVQTTARGSEEEAGAHPVRSAEKPAARVDGGARELYPAAVDLCRTLGKDSVVTVGNLRRNLRARTQRAVSAVNGAKICVQLEHNGVIGPYEPALRGRRLLL